MHFLQAPWLTVALEGPNDTVQSVASARVTRSITKTGNLNSLRLLMSSDAIPKAPGLRYQVKVHSNLQGLNKTRQKASQDATLLVSSDRGKVALTKTVNLARATGTAKPEQRMAKVQWRWLLLTPSHRQVRHQRFHDWRLNSDANCWDLSGLIAQPWSKNLCGSLDCSRTDHAVVTCIVTRALTVEYGSSFHNLWTIMFGIPRRAVIHQAYGSAN